MSSKLGVENIAHTNGTNAMTISSGGVTAFTTDPFNSVIETFYYGTGDHLEGNNQVLNRGFTRLTTNATANKNGGMTESTGTWTFPSTGVWSTMMSFVFYDSQASNSTGLLVAYSSDSGSNFTSVHGGYQAPKAVNAHGFITIPYIFNITNVSTERIRYMVSSGGGVYVRGGSGWNTLKVQFIKLCPSV
jgi:hypothetical protein|tara:strand:- start:551 stop:1117 length:567 start_codon:yes stop_codon:yes gene_type:complete